MAEPKPNMSDRREQAEIDKTRAETRKLELEAAELERGRRFAGLTEGVKLVGGVVLGLGGLLAAWTQYEVAELRAATAKSELAAAAVELAKAEEAKAGAVASLARARSELDAAEQAKRLALASEAEAEAKRDQANKEREEAARATAAFKDELARLTREVGAAKPELVRKKLVYVQFRGAIARERIDEYRATLAGDGFNAPAAERLAGEYRSMVKYFAEGDAAEAARVASLTQDFFEGRGCPVRIDTVLAKVKGSPPPQLEVWLSHSCP